jgi:hypothetical protein
MVLIDWDAHQQLVIADSRRAVSAFLSEAGNPPLAAIGYWVCVGIGYASPPPFAINANPRRFYEAKLAAAKASNPDFTDSQMRWDSGYFQYPACIELNTEVSAMATMLNDLVDTGENGSEEVNAGMIKICCSALAALARDGILGDVTNIDFVIQTANDSWYENEMQHTRDRDRVVRALIMAQ